jgi:hypothetical protein
MEIYVAGRSKFTSIRLFTNLIVAQNYEADQKDHKSILSMDHPIFEYKITRELKADSLAICGITLDGVLFLDPVVDVIAERILTDAKCISLSQVTVDRPKLFRSIYNRKFGLNDMFRIINRNIWLIGNINMYFGSIKIRFRLDNNTWNVVITKMNYILHRRLFQLYDFRKAVKFLLKTMKFYDSNNFVIFMSGNKGNIFIKLRDRTNLISMANYIIKICNTIYLKNEKLIAESYQNNVNYMYMFKSDGLIHITPYKDIAKQYSYGKIVMDPIVEGIVYILQTTDEYKLFYNTDTLVTSLDYDYIAIYRVSVNIKNTTILSVGMQHRQLHENEPFESVHLVLKNRSVMKMYRESTSVWRIRDMPIESTDFDSVYKIFTILWNDNIKNIAFIAVIYPNSIQTFIGNYHI